MDITRQSITVDTPLPIQFTAAINGTDVTIYNVAVAGLVSIFDNLPESSKSVILEACARQARGIK